MGVKGWRNTHGGPAVCAVSTLHPPHAQRTPHTAHRTLHTANCTPTAPRAPGMPSAGVAAPNDAECVVCLDVLEVPVVTPCSHWFCRECIISCLQSGQHT
jgi:hypothetical protein